MQLEVDLMPSSPSWPSPCPDKAVPLDPYAGTDSKGIPHAGLIEYEGVPHGPFATASERLQEDILALLRRWSRPPLWREVLDDSSDAKRDDLAQTGGKLPKVTKKTAVVGAAIGIGSAAIVAALLYANRKNTKS